MKKITFLFIFLILLIGCSLSNTPTSQVEDLLTKYQTLNSEIEEGIDDILSSENLTDSQRDRYRKLLEKQYKNFTYEIKDEVIDGDSAVVTTELELLNYKIAVNKTNDYYSNVDDYTVEEYNDTKLNNLENIKDKVVYTAKFNVKKDNDGNWKVEALDNETIKKIQGMY